MEKDLANSVGIVETRKIRVVEADSPLTLQSGKTLAPVDVAYETYGTLSERKDNAVMICHALSGNAHVAGYNSPDDKKTGWWDLMIGPGKPIDTNKYFVICSNFLGGCSGTTGPSDINPAAGKPYGPDFPIITIGDIVRVQKLLLDKLGIPRLLSVIGGSMGGMQVLQWAIAYPDLVDSVVCIAATSRLNSQSIAFDAVGRNAIVADSNFAGGRYHGQDGPARGLAIARMIGHITYLSEESMREKFGRQLYDSDKYSYDFNSEFSIETYLDYQGQAFVERFDANSYLYITKAMDYFDLVLEYGSLRKAFADCSARFCVISFRSDWLFPSAQSEEIVEALCAESKDVTYCNIESNYGHDAFLLGCPTQEKLIAGFLDATLHRVRTGQKVLSGQNRHRSSLKKFDRSKRLRVDYELIDAIIEPNSRVLDLGCGDGELMARLIQDKNIIAEGIELDEDLVAHCAGQGLPVIHRDIERGLGHYQTDSFDYAIVSQTLQTLRDPQKVIKELLRVGRKVIVSFPNFAHWTCRLQLMLAGKAPRTGQLPFKWYNTPNTHFLSLKDFDRFCAELNIRIERKIPLGKSSTLVVKILPNLLASQAVYITSRI